MIKRLVFLAMAWTLSGPSFANPADCYERTQAEALFGLHNYELSMALCAATGTSETVTCYHEARALFRVDPVRNAVALCKGAPDTAPVDCYRAAYNQVSDPRHRSRHALQLCSARQ